MKSQRFQLFYSVLVAVLWLVTMPASAQYNRVAAFSFVTNNGAITITGYTAPAYIGPGGPLDIPDSTNGYSVTGIGTYAFFDCNPTSVTIPDSITNISEGAFGYCLWLTNIVVGAGNPSYASVDGLLFNKSMTLLMQYSAGLTASNYSIPGNINRIGEHAFAGCVNLTSVTVPNSVTNIGEWAFSFCYNLTDIMIPSSVTSLEHYTFLDCSLTRVTLPNSVTSIGMGAFYGSSITEITIPTSMTNISAWALWGCSSLTNIYFLGNAPTADSTAFSGDNLATAYYLPGTTGWGSMLDGIPTALWLPQLQTAMNSGASANAFGLIINWASGQTVVVEASTNLFNPDWQPVQTNTLTTGSAFFSDPQWTNYPNRFYRLRSL